MLTFVTGPVRSGKTAYALALAATGGKRASYVATAVIDPADGEMAARVSRHRADRRGLPAIEVDERAGPSLAEVVGRAGPDDVLVIDSLGTWLAAALLGREAEAERAPDGIAEDLDLQATFFHAACLGTQAEIIVVAEETGWGIVPVSATGRLFRDAMGRAASRLALAADRAYLVVAGYAIDLRASGVPVRPRSTTPAR